MQQTKLGSQHLEDCRSQASPTRQSHPSNTKVPPPKNKRRRDFSAPRKSRLSAPQLQAQLSDRTRFRRLKKTLPSKGALAAGDKD